MNLSGKSKFGFLASATSTARYVFTAQFLSGAAAQTRQAFAIESKVRVAEEDKVVHLSCVVSAIMQSVAALEADVWDILNHGPGHHLGSNGIDRKAQLFLKPIAAELDRANFLKKGELILHLLEKPALDRGGQVYEETDLLIKLRNEITHYKSQWGNEMEQKKFIASLKQPKKSEFPSPPWFAGSGVNFFPQQCLGAKRASWAVDTSMAYLKAFYEKLGVRCPLDGYAASMFSCSDN